MSTPFLTDAEVAELCAPLRRGAAQARYIRERLGVPVQLKPNGRPLVSRLVLERVLAGMPSNQLLALRDSQTGPEPDSEAFLRYLSQRRKR